MSFPCGTSGRCTRLTLLLVVRDTRCLGSHSQARAVVLPMCHILLQPHWQGEPTNALTLQKQVDTVRGGQGPAGGVKPCEHEDMRWGRGGGGAWGGGAQSMQLWLCMVPAGAALFGAGAVCGTQLGPRCRGESPHGHHLHRLAAAGRV
jgi:hypothetical protein